MTTQRKHGSSRAVERHVDTSAYCSPACSMHDLDVGHAPADQPNVRIKRIYDDPTPADGFRVLVDRIWPRGITKQEAHLDAWLRELAPSTELRKWFGHDPKRWSEFRERYRTELGERALELATLRQRAARERVTLLYGARDPQFNQAVVLSEVVREA